MAAVSVPLTSAGMRPSRLAAAVLPRVEARGQGRIVNVSSVGGFVIQPTAAVHAATKSAVRAISEGLRKESSKVRCSCIYPGVATSELANTTSDEQPGDVDVNEIAVRLLATQGGRGPR